MKQLLTQYSAYNLWTNKMIIAKISELPDELLRKNMEDSFGGIFGTCVHLMNVEDLWWERLQLAEHIEWPAKNFTGNFDDLKNRWVEFSNRWHQWVDTANERQVTHVFEYQNSKKEIFKQPVFEVLLHLFNHQTFHRGQIITMMRQNAIAPIPPTDFIVFSRIRKNKNH
ncbi:MAG: DinB family protein [Ginsengibacter sp.]